MTKAKRFVLDANVLIQARNTYYGFDLCPGFWKALVQEHENRRIFSIERVKDELAGWGDDLDEWANETAPKSFFKKTDDIAVVRSYRKMLTWVQGQPQFSAAAKAEFATVADGWVIAFAEANDYVVVTHEVLAPAAQKKVPMPNVCNQFGVECVNTFEMLKELHVRFILGKNR